MYMYKKAAQMLKAKETVLLANSLSVHGRYTVMLPAKVSTQYIIIPVPLCVT